MNDQDRIEATRIARGVVADAFRAMAHEYDTSDNVYPVDLRTVAAKLEAQDAPTLGRTVMVVCRECGNKRCPHAHDSGAACTNSNEPPTPAADPVREAVRWVTVPDGRPVRWVARQNDGARSRTYGSAVPTRVCPKWDWVEFETESGKWGQGEPNCAIYIPALDSLLAPGEIRWVGDGPDPREAATPREPLLPIPRPEGPSYLKRGAWTDADGPCGPEHAALRWRDIACDLHAALVAERAARETSDANGREWKREAER